MISLIDTYLSMGVMALTWGCVADPGVATQSQDALRSNDDVEDVAANGEQAEGSGTVQDRAKPNHHRHHHRAVDACDANAQECPTPCTPKACTTVKPTNPLITDWRDVAASGMFVDNDSCSHPGRSWWQSFFGGPYVYPAVQACTDTPAPQFPLTQSINGEWNVQGTVGTWSGFGLWFAPCTVDLSSYRGISFSIWGDVGETHRLLVGVPTSENSKPSECQTNVGTCDPTTQQCRNAQKEVEVSVKPGQPITVLWSELSGGSPHAGVDPAQVMGIHFAFERTEWGGVVTPPFPVDVHVGAITLVP